MRDELIYWTRVLATVEAEVTPASFDAWFKPLKLHRIDEEIRIAYLEIENVRGSDFIISNLRERYLQLLQNTFKQVLDEEFRVVIKKSDEYEDAAVEESPVYETLSSLKSESANNETAAASYENEEDNSDSGRDILNDYNPDYGYSPYDRKETGEINYANNQPQRTNVKDYSNQRIGTEKIFNPKYTFDNFVVGSSNKYAHAVAQAVAESPSQTYNPVFIYGGSGLGKTHLMHAIGIHILKKNPSANVLYVSSEMFTNELITAIRTNRTEDFKSKYRKVDVLLIDDIQFLEGKESTQEEFFYTFNTLYSQNKQIIISSDRAPNKLKNLDDRLISRFGSNMVADIQTPDYETRVAILTKKAENLDVEIDNDCYEVICMISNKIKDNIRELEGAFTRIVSFSKLLNEKIDVACARRTLSDVVGTGEIDITPSKIKKVVAHYYGIKISDLESEKKTKNIAYPRQVAMYLIRYMTDASLPQIGRFFGNKHHTTVKHAVEKIDNEIMYDDNLKNTIEELKKKIKE